ncbi:BamA/TamA family outer membrane protein [Marinigracilibium pacificum]|uniref:BamA/TamA family outer membrane protein n=1 Tax=Marinigracilibium pacificum TaxID=2729599 RepID=A0A848J2T6_9BACT|nr:BamA/TamA family outer membrane protein [Marinigracilibium pacificum]NMM50041.1 BamA/TamA family outer membrane protein [Marinigracilibium pacificum]
MNNPQKIKAVFIFLCFTFMLPMIGQEKDSVTSDNEQIKKGKLYFTPLPAIASNPTSGFIYGVAASGGMYLGDPNDTRISSAFLALTYSTKKQLALILKSNVFSNKEKWNFLGDWRYLITNQPTYGLGTGPQSEKPVGNGITINGITSQPIPDDQMMFFSLVRFHETAFRKVKDNFYLGLGYHLDYHFDIDDVELDVDNSEGEGIKYTSHYKYSVDNGFNPEEYWLSGISLNAAYDSRDNAINPYKGMYSLITFRVNPEFLGSDKNSTSLWAEFRDYYSLSKKKPRHLLAIWLYTNIQTSGTLPYMNLPAVGWDVYGRSGRAYTQGRFRGENVGYAEMEYRVPLPPILKKYPDLLGLVAFVNATTASSKPAGIKFMDNIDPAAGLGLRVMLNSKSRANVTIDYAWGKYGERGLYFNLNETF